MRKQWLAGMLGTGLLLTFGATAGAALTGEQTEAVQEQMSAEQVSAEQVSAEQEQISAELEQEISRGGDAWYEIFVRSFCDSDEDGIGDLDGVTGKLDYVKELGFDGIWLMPVMPSQTYHKYDVTDYYSIDPEYGNLDDMKELLAAAKEKEIRVIIDLVFNHTSSGHPWFVEACDYLETIGDEEPDLTKCPYVDYYHFAKEPGVGNWYPVGETGWYYEGQFWSEMPDLNLDSEAVRGEIEAVTDFWLELGVDGFRLDAAKEYFTGNKTKNIEVLEWYTGYVKEQNQDAYLVAEVWDSVETIASYYKSGIDSIFDYTFGNSSGQIIQKINQADNGKAGGAFGRNLQKVTALYQENNPGMINAPFLSNHDTGRVSGFVSYDPARVKFAGAMNLFMSGNVFVYYGEELGMTGSGIDENKRASMYWSAKEGVEGMVTEAPPQMEQQEHRFGSLEEQEEDSNSIYNYYKTAISLRNQYPALAMGETVSLSDTVADPDVCAIQKTCGDQTLYFIYNFSKEESEIPLEQLPSQADLAAGLCTDTQQEVVLTETSLVLPPYGIALLMPQ